MMDDSGDDFAWQETFDRQETSSSSSMDDSDAEKEYKKKLHKELFKKPKQEINEQKHEVKSKKSKKSKHKDSLNSSYESDSYELNNVKVEPESDIDSVKKKKDIKKIKHAQDESMDVDNSSYLDLLVKEESNEHSHKRKKKKKRESMSKDGLANGDFTIHENESYNETLDVKREVESSEKKKKKKKKKESVCDIKECIVKDLFSEEETVVGPPVVEKDSTITNSNMNKRKSSSHHIHETHSDDNVGDSVMGTATKNGYHSESSEQSLKKKQSRKSPKLTRKERESRISDRIQFEEDSQLETNNTPNSQKLKQYLKNFSNLKSIKVKPSSECSITSDDEVWVLKCPSDFNVSSLENVNIPLNTSKFKIKIDGRTFDGNMDAEVYKYPILSLNRDKCTVQNITLQGELTLRKRIPKAHFIEDKLNNIETENFIPLPDTKCRHPLFGPNYKKTIKVAADVQDRLNKYSREVTPPPNEKKKKKKHKTQVKCEEMSIVEEKSERITETREERKKRKRSGQNLQEPEAKRSRTAPAWDCEEDIQDHLFNY